MGIASRSAVGFYELAVIYGGEFRRFSIGVIVWSVQWHGCDQLIGFIKKVKNVAFHV